MSDPVAPVCSIDPIIKPTQPPQAPFPAIPQAVDLPSALRAINAMAAIIRNITGQLGRSSGGGGGGHTDSRSKQPPKQGRWVQKTVNRKTVRIFNPQDKTQFVDVSRVANLVMQDSVTGEEWIYTGSDLG